ncbi:hypothetical protein HanLR1_Chr06g0208121 [Helianthus annuus]|nr:hypothetical protein HanLR1_Chr06g0208121 [Helianthus annuus]
MMLGRMSRKARPVVREKVVRMFCPDLKGKVVVLACEDGEEGFNYTIRDNFRLPERDAMQAVLPQGKGGGSAAAGGSSVGVKAVDDKKMKGDAPDAGGQKGPKLRRTRTAAIPQPKPAVTTSKLIICYTSVSIPDVTDRCSLFCVENREEPVSLFVAPPSSPKLAGVETQKEDRRSPSIEVRGQKPKSPVAEKPKSPVAKKPSGSTAAGTGVEDQPSIQPGEIELEFYYRSYAVDRGLDYHHPPWTVMQMDDISNNPLACREILGGGGGLGTPYETLRARGLPRENRINQLSSMLVGSSIIANAIMEDYKVLGRKEEETVRLRAEAEAMVKAAREGAEHLKKDKASFEKLKQTKTWAASAGLKQVRTLAKLLSDERKGWREACARENEKLFRVRQELNNLKAANAALLKEKAAAEAVTKEAEASGAKVLEEADADRSKLNKAVEVLKVEVQNRVTILEEATARASEDEARQGKLRRLEIIVGTILDAPENVTAINELKECARQAGFKAGYNKCLSHVNPFYKSRFTDERSGFHGVDTEALYAAAVDAYNNLSISSIEDIEKCLEANDYVDRLRLLYERPEEEEEAAGGEKNDDGTSGTKVD